MSITIEETRPDSPHAVELLSELDSDLQQHFYPPQSRHAYSVEKLLREGVNFFIASYNDQLAGCGGIKLYEDYGEIKRMYVRPSHRGRGLGKAILNTLSEFAKERGIGILRLETGIYQTEAIGLYDAYGFQRCAPFGEYKADPLSVYFEKAI
jgi:GNAT superfamily N-acetyltransferase